MSCTLIVMHVFVCAGGSPSRERVQKEAERLKSCVEVSTAA